ncbi:GNAT family N-acetyltransferase [Streptococcus cuniculi]|uniref:GNAT family N-acetyltransferase n=1 Tax=Streptococcus cuniculi TaxID=1432788 RepID=A0A4Y9JBC4_9STRE|nr:GNAT family N-acetyltransferase [Streptococcus cuniculi]MBF0778122.1 GNAT family N-acetyltransferase [Streptococcus cuniculi]TFU98127.1 GNAT family N-acetyltransferase [Streptococcus cuniculi]
MKEHAVRPITTFQSWQKIMVRYGLASGLGRLFSDDSERSFLYDLGNFLFLAGEGQTEFLQCYTEHHGLEHKILISEEDSWQTILNHTTDFTAFTRYAFENQADFEIEHLAQLVQSLPQHAEIQPIDAEIYQQLQSEAWSEDLKGAWQTFSDFQAAGGYGFVIELGDMIGAGISTGLVYQGAIEIEIATAPAYQRQGLARSLAAKMILTSCERRMFPLWDAHNEASKNLAEQLGYRLISAYPSYEEREE